MKEIKEALTKNKCGSMAISATLIMTSLYSATASFSVLGLIFFVLLNILIFFVIERLLYADYNILLNKRSACVLILIGIVSCVLSVFVPKLIDNVLSLTILALLLPVIAGLSYAGRVKDKTSKYFIAFTVFGLGFAALYMVFASGAFSPDSYMYYDISKTTFNDYGNAGIIRQYVIDSIYNCSFPYLHPFIIFVVDKATGLGLYSGVLIDFYAMLFTLLLAARLSKKITSAPFAGIIAAVVLITSPYYLDEVCAGRAIPVSLLLILFILSVFSSVFFENKKLGFKALVLGLTAGLAVSCRFDNMPLAAYCFLIVLTIKESRIKNAVLYAAGGLIAVSPWVVYSFVRFGKPWITDNSGTAFMVESKVPTRVVLPGEKAATLFSDPGLWFKALFGTKILILFGLIICSIAGLICFVFCCCWLYKIISEKKTTFRSLRCLLMVALFYFLKCGMYVVFGYPEERYHIETVFIMTFALVAFCFDHRKKISFNPLMIAIVPSAVLTCVLYVASYGSLGFPYWTEELVARVKDGDMNAVTEWAVLDKIDKPREEISDLNNVLDGLLSDNESVLVVENCYELDVLADYLVYADPDPSNCDTIEFVVENHSDIRYVVTSNTYSDAAYFAEKYPGKTVGDFIIFDVRNPVR